MMARTLAVVAVCAALAACNSKPAEQPVVVATDTVNTTVAPAPAPVAIKPAPEGLPSRVAREVISATGLPCAGVAKADRDAADGSIVASCTSGEAYRVYTEEGKGAIAVAL